MLGIVYKHLEAGRVDSVVDRVHVVGDVVGTESCDGGIKVAPIEDDQQVINQIVDIPQMLESVVPGSVGVEPLNLVVVLIGVKAKVCRIPEAMPGIDRTVCRDGGVIEKGLDVLVVDREPGFNFDDIVIIFIAPEVRFRIASFRSFLRLKNTPIDAVQIKVVIATACISCLLYTSPSPRD